jgi:two-component system cell cycle sensor histidine kinase/response regulator CckA
VDLVILDMIMPDMSGGETFNRLRAIKPDVKILLSSGYSLNGQASEIMQRGCNGFIQKPFNVKQISRKIREILDT